MTIVVNILCGPGGGKSTTAAGVFYELKQADVNCELVTEYAKDLVWGRTTTTLGNQVYIMAKQYHRLWRLLGQVDVVVTDCPLFLSLYYGEKESDAFKQLALELFYSMDNITFFLRRVKTFNPAGRVQTEDKAREIDVALEQLLQEHSVNYSDVVADRHAARLIASRVLQQLTSQLTTSKT